MRFGIGMNTDHTMEEVGQFGDQRAYPADQSQGATEVEASVEVTEAQVVPGQLIPRHPEERPKGASRRATARVAHPSRRATLAPQSVRMICHSGYAALPSHSARSRGC